jgi:hypothetical protein
MAALFGDTTESLTGRQHGGSQTLVGSEPTNLLFGDAGLDLLDHAVGGNDTLVTSGAGSLFGDAGGNIADHARGGDDTLSAQVLASAITVGETFIPNMYGDTGGDISAWAIAGDDTLITEHANESDVEGRLASASRLFARAIVRRAMVRSERPVSELSWPPMGYPPFSVRSAGLYFPRNTAERRSTKDWMPSFMSSLLKTRSLILGM